MADIIIEKGRREYCRCVSTPVPGSIHEAEDMPKSFLLDNSEAGKRTLQPSAKERFWKEIPITFVGLMPLAERSSTPFCEVAQSGASNDHRLQLRDRCDMSMIRLLLHWNAFQLPTKS